jgi:hypothetical protein
MGGASTRMYNLDYFQSLQLNLYWDRPWIIYRKEYCRSSYGLGIIQMEKVLLFHLHFH